MRKASLDFFKVVWQSQTYLSTFYLLLSFPIGIFYFVFLVTALSLGLGLLITLLGIPLLFGTLLLWRVLGIFERELTTAMLGIKISPPIKIKQQKGIWKTVQAYLSDSYTWRSLAYLFIKFPLGIINFVVFVTMLSVSLSLVATPILYYITEIGILKATFCVVGNICFITSYFSAFLWGVVGVLMFFVSLHAFNGLAQISGLLAKTLLEKKK
ncbi:hypothetical protein GOV05_00240 [Candidatus Woesearchaeota archaeon]|nr:hypothetical protein [Candidatus Woesearchaeota archaeon]